MQLAASKRSPKLKFSISEAHAPATSQGIFLRAICQMPAEVFRITGIGKSYGAVHALRWADTETCSIMAGEVWAFAGENGAGKSTLAAILAGITGPNAGSIQFCGQPYSPSSIAEARALGIQLIFQEPALLPTLTVAENLFLGREKRFTTLGLRRVSAMKREAVKLLADICPHISPTILAGDLELEDQKLVETARAVSTNPKCIIFDETTAVMSSRNTNTILDLIRRIKKSTSIIIVTHRTEEIFGITDRLLILKDGAFVAVKDTAQTTPNEFADLLVGREINLSIRDAAQPYDSKNPEHLLEIDGLTVDAGVNDISLRLCRGKIVGIGGLAGAGQECILRALYGLDRLQSGSIRVKGKLHTAQSPRTSLRHGLLYSPKNRDREGLILQQKIRTNIVLSILPRLSKAGFASKRREAVLSNQLSRRFNIKCRSVEDLCRNLSGGNRQKVVLAKLLSTEGDIFLLDNPTRGIDIGARSEIYHLMNDLTSKGGGILLVSDELQELLQMSDDIILLRRGVVSKIFNRTEKPDEGDLIRHMI